MPVSYLDIASQDDVGQRIDNFLMRQLKGVPRQHIYRILRSGEVRVNGGRIAPRYRLQLNDRVRVPPIKTRNQATPSISTTHAEGLLSHILYEDDELIVLNKPAGLAVHGGSSVSAGVIEMLRHVYHPKLELVHRIDRDTSGCLAIAKKRATLKRLQQAFRERRVKKHYALIVAGSWPGTLRSVQLKLERYQTQWGERRVRVSSQGQPARTDFEVVEQTSQASWLTATLHTGRTHQIRVHSSASGYPILGDAKYGREVDIEVPRLCLHAQRLVLPTGDEWLRIDAPADEQMKSIWQTIKSRS